MMGKLMQLACTLIICTLNLSMGILCAWPSSTYRLFESTNTTLHRPMTDTELALFSSLPSVGALIATPVFGIYLDRLGRRNSSILSSLLATIAWAMVSFSSRIEVILFAMFVCGLSGAIVLIVPVYIGEICQESIRGAACSCITFMFGLGLLSSYLLGGYLSYSSMVYVCLTITTLSTAALTLLKESPICLMIKGKEKDAAEALGFYRRVKTDSKVVLEELNAIRRSLNPELDDITPEEEKQLKPEREIQEKLSLWKFIKKSSSTRAAIYMTHILMATSIFQGLVVVQAYAEPLFKEAIPNMPDNVGSILLAVVVTLAGLVSAYITEVAGRRPLMIYSSFVAAASCLLLGIQIQFHWGPGWLIAVNIYFFTIVYSIGGGTVPFMIFAEVFLPEVRSLMSMSVVQLSWLCSSIILFIFNPLLKAIGLGPVFYIFAGVSVFVGVYCIFYLPETKGLPVDAIQERLTKKKKIKKLEDVVHP